MTEAEKLEIDRILSAIADEGATRERMERLDALLRDRPELQDYYARVMAMHTVLAYEFSLSDQPFKPVLRPLGPRPLGPRPLAEGSAQPPVSGATAPEGDACRVLSRRIQRDLAAHRARRTRVWRTALAVGCAASLAIAALGYALWFHPGDGGGVARRDRPWSPSGSGEEDVGGVVVRDERSLQVLGRLTRDARITSVRLPKLDDGATPAVTLCSGAAWIERADGQRERGYLVALPPACQMEVYLDTDADGHNALAVAEIDQAGRTTGFTLQFNNKSDGGADTVGRRTGAIGKFTQFNDSSSTKYYLLAGSHMLYGESKEELWRQSDYRVQLDSENLLVIGWDDSGYSGRVVRGPEQPLPDYDYNDMRALMFFSSPGGERSPREPELSYAPPPLSPARVARTSGVGYVIDVKPGEELVLMVSGYARYQNAFRVVDAESGRVVWRHTGSPPGSAVAQARDRGVYVIRNYGTSTRTYELQGRYKPDDVSDQAPWRVTPFKVLATDEGSVTVGFEDSVDVPSRVDWKDIRVYARWLSD